MVVNYIFAKIYFDQLLDFPILNTKQLVDTTFWLKPWLMYISLGSNFDHLGSEEKGGEKVNKVVFHLFLLVNLLTYIYCLNQIKYILFQL